MVRIKTLREGKGLRQEELAHILGVSRSAVAMWETDKSYPRGETLAKLASVLDCTIDELYAREPPGQDSA